MADYDRDLVVSIAGAVRAYVGDVEPEAVAIEVLTDLEAEGWQIRHPNDTDGGAYEPGSADVIAVEATRPRARPWDYFRYRRWRPDS
jgi:hypothetical protein